MAYLFQQLIENMKFASKIEDVNIKEQSLKSLDWLQATVMKIKPIQTDKLIQKTESDRRVQTLARQSIGKMYMFIYDPKLKNTLPYYDRYPLIFPIQYYDDGFLGINLHYLPVVLRAKLMKALYTTINNKSNDASTRLLISYKILDNAAKFRGFKPCVKRYLFSHVRSPFVYISPEEWDVALLLPTYKFVKQQAETVWRDSRQRIIHNAL